MPGVLPAGAVLAGGRSLRMGGQTKALVDLNGIPLIQHVIDRLRPQVCALAISVEHENSVFECFALPQIADPRRGSCGPLGGLLAALEALPTGVDYLLLAPCDAPFLPEDMGQRLQQHLDLNGRAACIARYRGELQPTFSLWHRRVLPDLRPAVLEDGLGGFKQFAERADVSILDWAPARVSPFFNVNTPADLARARSLLASGLIAGKKAAT